MKNTSLVGPVFRVTAALVLCAACFQSGRWYQELAGPGHLVVKRDAGNEMVQPTHSLAAQLGEKTVEQRPLEAAGDPIGETGDIITPLNVRDPSALVIGPGAYHPVCPPTATAEPAPLSKRRKKEMESGQLLELLRRGGKDAKDAAPQSY